MSVSIEPVRLAQTQLKPVTHMMGRAFVNDPFLKYLAPDDPKRTRLTPEFVGIVVNLLRSAWMLWGSRVALPQRKWSYVRYLLRKLLLP
jgi:hypothetical protein